MREEDWSGRWMRKDGRWERAMAGRTGRCQNGKGRWERAMAGRRGRWQMGEGDGR